MSHSSVFSTNFLALFLLSACIFLVHADDEGDPCIALQQRIIDAYDSPECAYARIVTSEGDVWAGETPPDPIVCSKADGDGLSCVKNVTETVDGFVEHGCAVPEPVEEIMTFMYPISGNDVEFVKSTQFYCTADDCYAIVRDALQDPMNCNLTEPLSGNEYGYAECFRSSVPCGCVNSFAMAYKESSPEFVEDFGPPSIIIDAAEKAFELGYCVDSGTEPTTSGGNVAGNWYHLHGAIYVFGCIALKCIKM